MGLHLRDSLCERSIRDSQGRSFQFVPGKGFIDTKLSRLKEIYLRLSVCPKYYNGLTGGWRRERGTIDPQFRNFVMTGVDLE